MMKSPLLIAWACVLSASLCFAVLFAMPRFANADLSWAQIAFVRYLGGFVCVTFYGLISGRWRRQVTRNYWHIHVPRALFGIGTVGCIVYATRSLAYSDAIAVGFSKGGFVLLFSALLLREAVGAVRCVGLCLSFAGALVILSNEQGGLSMDIFSGAGGIALLGAIFMAGEVVLLKMATLKDNALGMLAWVNGTGMIVALCLSLPDGMPDMNWSLLPVILMGPIAVFGQMLNYFGHRQADASFLAPLGYTTIVYSIVIGWVAFSESLSFVGAVGAFLVIAGGAISARTPLNTLVSPVRIGRV